MLEELYSRYHAMDPQEIIGVLYKIHDFHRIPHYPYHPVFYPQTHEKSLYFFYEILSHLSSLKLQPVQVRQLLEMLFWPEIKERRDRSEALCIIKCIERFPSPTFIPLIQVHLQFLKERKKAESPGTEFYGTISEEIRRVEKLLKLLRECED